MPVFEVLKSFWENLSADWTPFALGSQPYLIPIYRDSRSHHDLPSREIDPLLRSSHHASQYGLSASGFPSGRVNGDVLTPTLGESTSHSPLSRAPGANIVASCNSKAAGSPEIALFSPSIISFGDFFPEPAVMGQPFTKPSEGLGETLPLIDTASETGDINVSHTTPSKKRLHGTVGFNPMRDSNVGGGVSAVTADGIVYKKVVSSSQAHASLANKEAVGNPRSGAGEPTFVDMHRTPSQTSRLNVQLTTSDKPRAKMPSSSSGSSKGSNASSTTRNAHAALDRIMTRNLDQTRDVGIAYEHPPSLSGPQSEDGFDALADVEEARSLEHNNPHLPLLRHVPPAPEAGSIYTLSPYSGSSDDVPVYFSNSPHRRWDLGPGYCDEWWQINFDDWNTCIGVYLMGYMVVMAVLTCVVIIWVLLHQ